jgi:hypothetical protein
MGNCHFLANFEPAWHDAGLGNLVFLIWGPLVRIQSGAPLLETRLCRHDYSTITAKCCERNRDAIGFTNKVERFASKGGRLTTKAKLLELVGTKCLPREIKKQRRCEWPVNHKATVMLCLNGIWRIIMNAVAVKGQR